MKQTKSVTDPEMSRSFWAEIKHQKSSNRSDFSAKLAFVWAA